MSMLMIVLLLLLQFITGFGLLTLFRIRLKPGMLISLAVLLGVAVHSFIPFLLELFGIPVTAINIFIALITPCLLLNVTSKRNLSNFRNLGRETNLNIKLYEIPFLIVIGFIVFVSIWRCFYYPPTSRDLTSGAEVIAEYAVREKTMINSVFSLNLERMNNHFKPPFITSLQIIYKYAGFPFGQIWLCNIFVCFIIFLYHALSLTIHRILAGSLIILFLAIPEMYAYTFMVLFDYSNAVFFFLSTYFVLEFFKSGAKKHIVFAGFLMGIATYIRAETLALACLLALMIAWHHFRKRGKFLKLIISGIVFLLPAALIYFLIAYLYINFYLPIQYDIPGLLNPNLSDLSGLFNRFRDINSILIFSEQGIIYYGYFFFVFLSVLLIDLIYNRGLNKIAQGWIYSVLVIYFGLALLGYLLPLLDLDNSTKRGFFKIFPLMLLYMGNSSLLIDISERIGKWEITGKLKKQPSMPNSS